MLKPLFYLRRNPNGSIYCFYCPDKAIMDECIKSSPGCKYKEIPASCVKRIFGFDCPKRGGMGKEYKFKWPQ
jgi:hypothetical protein